MLIRIALLGCLALSVKAVTPPLIDYVTYLGGSFTETIAGIAVDSTGAAYVAGNTSSPDFPVTSTSLGTPSTNNCAFVTKFNPSGTAIDFSICLANSTATALTLDASGNIYLAIATLVNPFVVPYNYAVVKLDPTAQNILYTAPIGGLAESMAVDATGDIYVTGAAGSGLSTTPGVYQSQSAGAQCSGEINAPPSPCTNAFITKLSPFGSVAWTTYLGGAGPDDAHAVAVDGVGNVWVAGSTVSPNFPTTPGAISRVFHGEIDLGPLRFGDAFVAKLDPTGAHLLYSTYLGGSGPDAFGIAVDSTGSAYVAGGTQSPDFPTTSGSFQKTYSGYQANQQPTLAGNGFVTKIDSSGQLIYSTFAGVNTQASAIAVDASGQAYVSVLQAAFSSMIQTTCATPATPAVLVLNSIGDALTYTSPVPGAYLALDGKGGLYSAGSAFTLVFFSTPRVFQTQYGGGNSDAFAAKVDFSQPAAPTLASVLNAASLFPGYATQFPTGAVAPGEIVTLFGSGFGSAQPSVSFGQSLAPVLYSSDCQINAVVPFEVTPSLTTLVTVQPGGGSGAQALGPVKLPVVVAAPAIFTVTESGAGQGAILNQDSSVNSSANPAAQGSIVSVYLTGVGALNPSISDGSLGPLSPPYPTPLAGITATIGGLNAPVIFAGQAPGLIAGATQVNIQIPQDAPTGPAVPIVIFAADYASQYTHAVTLAVH